MMEAAAARAERGRAQVEGREERTRLAARMGAVEEILADARTDLRALAAVLLPGTPPPSQGGGLDAAEAAVAAAALQRASSPQSEAPQQTDAAAAMQAREMDVERAAGGDCSQPERTASPPPAEAYAPTPPPPPTAPAAPMGTTATAAAAAGPWGELSVHVALHVPPPASGVPRTRMSARRSRRCSEEGAGSMQAAVAAPPMLTTAAAAAAGSSCEIGQQTLAILRPLPARPLPPPQRSAAPGSGAGSPTPAQRSGALISPPTELWFTHTVDRFRGGRSDKGNSSRGGDGVSNSSVGIGSSSSGGLSSSSSACSDTEELLHVAGQAAPAGGDSTLLLREGAGTANLVTIAKDLSSDQDITSSQPELAGVCGSAEPLTHANDLSSYHAIESVPTSIDAFPDQATSPDSATSSPKKSAADISEGTSPNHFYDEANSVAGAGFEPSVVPAAPCAGVKTDASAAEAPDQGGIESNCD